MRLRAHEWCNRRGWSRNCNSCRGVFTFTSETENKNLDYMIRLLFSTRTLRKWLKLFVLHVVLPLQISYSSWRAHVQILYMQWIVRILGQKSKRVYQISRHQIRNHEKMPLKFNVVQANEFSLLMHNHTFFLLLQRLLMAQPVFRAAVASQIKIFACVTSVSAHQKYQWHWNDWNLCKRFVAYYTLKVLQWMFFDCWPMKTGYLWKKMTNNTLNVSTKFPHSKTHQSTKTRSW